MSQRNSWKLPNHTFKEKPKCQKVVDSWKEKSNRHSFNAQRTKYALMCFLEGNTTTHYNNSEPHHQQVGVVPIDEDPTFPPGEEGEKAKKDNQLYGCGICSESCVKVGMRKPIIYGCGHTNCAPCFNAWSEANHWEPDCPYCKKKITKAIRLFTLD